MRLRSAFIYFVVLIAAACSDQMTDDPIPFVSFNPIVMNLSLPEFNSLNTVGFKYVNGGVRGILVVKNGSSFVAYERNCSFQPNEACSTVEMHSSSLYIFDSCCSSTFDKNTGQPQSGPASRPLRRYAATQSGSELVITDDIVQ
jgi:nitrite reductase/ring-hydroxylating ferredoxin subunit